MTSKPLCLLGLWRLLGSIGLRMEQKRHLIRTLELYGEHGDGDKVFTKLLNLAGMNGTLGLHKEGIRLVKEAWKIQERFCNAGGLFAILFPVAQRRNIRRGGKDNLTCGHFPLGRRSRIPIILIPHLSWQYLLFGE